MSSFSVVIPAHNEEGSLEKIGRETSSILRDLSGDRYEVIIVDDGSTDQTPQVIRRLMAGDRNIKVITHSVRQGMGSCLKDGYTIAMYEWISFLPADGQINPSELKKFAEEMKGADFVSSYYLKRNDTFLRKIMSKTLRLILFIFLGPHPRFEGIYMFHRKILKTVRLISYSFVFNFELVAKSYQQGYQFREIGIVCLPRISGKSKTANIKTILTVLQEVIKLRIKEFKMPQQSHEVR